MTRTPPPQAGENTHTHTHTNTHARLLMIDAAEGSVNTSGVEQHIHGKAFFVPQLQTLHRVGIGLHDVVDVELLQMTYDCKLRKRGALESWYVLQYQLITLGVLLILYFLFVFLFRPMIMLTKPESKF